MTQKSLWLSQQNPHLESLVTPGYNHTKLKVPRALFYVYFPTGTHANTTLELQKCDFETAALTAAETLPVILDTRQWHCAVKGTTMAFFPLQKSYSRERTKKGFLHFNPKSTLTL